MKMTLQDFILHLDKAVTLEEDRLYRMTVTTLGRSATVMIEETSRDTTGAAAWKSVHKTRADIAPFGAKRVG